MTDTPDIVAVSKAAKERGTATAALKRHWYGLAPEAKRALAARVGMSYAQLSMVARGLRAAGPKMAVRIEEETGISRREIRPDLFN